MACSTHYRLFQETIFRVNHLTAAKTWLKPNQAATKLRHSNYTVVTKTTKRTKPNETNSWFRRLSCDLARISPNESGPFYMSQRPHRAIFINKHDNY